MVLLQLGTELMSVAYVKTEGPVDVCGLYCCWKPCRSPGFMFPLTVKGEGAVTADAVEKEGHKRLW